MANGHGNGHASNGHADAELPAAEQTELTSPGHTD